MPTPVGVHDPENAGIARAGRLADEGDLRRHCLRGRVQPRGECRGSSLGLRAASENREDRDSDKRDEGYDCRVSASATLRALPRFLDQRLDEGLELPVPDGIVRARRARRSGYGHGCLLKNDCASMTITMISVKVDKGDPTDLYEQVAAEIRRAIAEREAKPGERLPPAKDLAAVLGVNTNTVLRSLRLLRDEGLLEFRRGRGISVAGTPERGAVVQRARELVEFARHQGYRVDELVEIIESVG